LFLIESQSFRPVLVSREPTSQPRNRRPFRSTAIHLSSYATIKEDADSQLSAQISYQDKNGLNHDYRKHMVFYQDGLSLHQNGKIIPDCFICDDTYDFGEKAVNYYSPAFWQRLGLTVNGAPGETGFDLNAIAFL